MSKLSGKEGHGGSFLISAMGREKAAWLVSPQMDSSGSRNPNLEDLECRFLVKYLLFLWRNVLRPDDTVSGPYTHL